MTKMKTTVTFEYETRAPETWQSSDIAASSPQTFASKGIRAARKAIKPRGWTSLVVVIERLESGE